MSNKNKPMTNKELAVGVIGILGFFTVASLGLKEIIPACHKGFDNSVNAVGNAFAPLMPSFGPSK